MDKTIDHVETLIASLLCADAGDESHLLGRPIARGVSQEFDAGCALRFLPRFPRNALLADISQSRLFTDNAKLLLSSPQDLIGDYTEVAFLAGDCIKWSAFKKLTKRPRGVFVYCFGADLYEYHTRFIYPDGKSTYWKRVAAIDKKGRPVQAIIEGTKSQDGMLDGNYVVFAASMIEDAMRPGAFRATVTDHVGVTFPVPNGEHLDIFRLRDGPYSGSKRKALIHWVARHVRKTASGEHQVREHLRGVHDFEIEGLKVRLEPNDK